KSSGNIVIALDLVEQGDGIAGYALYGIELIVACAVVVEHAAEGSSVARINSGPFHLNHEHGVSGMEAGGIVYGEGVVAVCGAGWEGSVLVDDNRRCRTRINRSYRDGRGCEGNRGITEC